MEVQTLRQKDKKKRLTPVEKRYFRTAGYALVDHKRNEEILEQFKIENQLTRNYEDTNPIGYDM